MRLPPRKQLGKLIEAHAKAEDVAGKRMRRWVAAIALAQVLLQARDVGLIKAFAIKGGHAIELRVRRIARASRDVDVIIDAPKNGILDSLRSALAEGWSGFSFAFKADPQETNHAFRFAMDANYNGGDWATFDVEVMAGSVVDEDLVEPLNLSTFGLSAPEPIPCLNINIQLAQKFHGATDPSENRPRDLLDIYIIQKTFQLDDNRLRAEIESTFTERNTHAWPTTIDLRDGWDAQIADIIGANGFDFTVPDVLQGVHFLALRLIGVPYRMNYEYHFLVLEAHAAVPDSLTGAISNRGAHEAFERMTKQEGWKLAHLMRYPSRDITQAMLAVLERPMPEAK